MQSVKAVNLKYSKKYKPPTLAQKRAAYLKFLKDDVDWDWSSILKLLVFKLGRVRKCIVGYNRHTDAKETGREIAEVELRLQRVLDDRYFDELLKPHKKKYGEYDFEFVEIVDTKSRPGGPYSQMVSKYSKKLTKRQQKKADDERAILYGRAARLRDDDLRAAFALMTDKMMGWWD